MLQNNSVTRLPPKRRFQNWNLNEERDRETVTLTVAYSVVALLSRQALARLFFDNFRISLYLIYSDTTQPSRSEVPPSTSKYRHP